MGDESREAGVEVPEAVTVDVEEIHPLPEVSTGKVTSIPSSIRQKECILVKTNIKAILRDLGQSSEVHHSTQPQQV